MERSVIVPVGGDLVAAPVNLGHYLRLPFRDFSEDEKNSPPTWSSRSRMALTWEGKPSSTGPQPSASSEAHHGSTSTLMARIGNGGFASGRRFSDERYLGPIVPARSLFPETPLSSCDSHPGISTSCSPLLRACPLPNWTRLANPRFPTLPGGGTKGIRPPSIRTFGHASAFLAARAWGLQGRPSFLFHTLDLALCRFPPSPEPRASRMTHAVVATKRILPGEMKKRR